MHIHLFTIGIFITAYSALFAEPSKLASNSPFLPPGYNNKKPALPEPLPMQQTNGPLAKDFEFRGIVQIEGAYQFSVFRKSENKAYWISENGSESGIKISNFDLDSMRITLSANGQSEQITLMAASENPVPMPVATPPQMPMPIPNDMQKQVQPIATPINNTTQRPTPRRTIPRRRVILPKK